MRVLFHCRPSFTRFAGGDAVQILGTKQALENLGVQVDISTETSPNPRGYDIVHIFNPVLVSMAGASKAQDLGIPVAISTIYWPMYQYFRSYLGLIQEYTEHKPSGWLGFAVEAFGRYVTYTYLWNTYLGWRLKKFVALADLLLPNSQAEAKELAAQFQPRAKIIPVSNGVDLKVNTLAPRITTGLPKELASLEDYILCVGRLELRKNQHLLIQALHNSPQPLVFVGNMAVSTGYTVLCQKLGRKRLGPTYFIAHLPHELLPGVYERAALHVMPSWYETPGLSSLEAAAAGVPIVTIDQGGTREYFGPDATYCPPGDVQLLVEAISEALQKRPNPKLAERIRRDFSWEKAGAQTLAAYQHILKTKSR
ncbi:MAG: glycosyltransferase family 4 protein [Patescibacteria group bacterium]